MDHSFIISKLESNGEQFHLLLKDLKSAEYLWKPSPEKWCLLEVLCHLCDEEREDFRARVQHTLENPEAPLSPIDPVGWVSERKYLERDYTEMLHSFLQERKQSVAWLNSLSCPEWKNTHQHPKFGPMSAEYFLSNWLAHDYLHMRQIIGLKFQYLRFVSGEKLSYAGEW